MAGPFNLGNIASALRVTGANPSLADRLEQDAAVPEAPAPKPAPVVPPDANRVLELVGSQYRVPAAEAPAPVETAATRTASAPAFDPSASTRELKAQQTGNVNELIESKREGGAIAAEGADRQAAVYGEAAAEGRAGVEDVKGRRDEARARKDENTKQAYASLREMQEQIGNPPDTSKGKALQVIGAILSMTRGGAGVGGGMQLLGQMMGDDVQAWERGIAGNDKIRKSLMEMNEAEDRGVESELEQEQRLSGLAAATYVNALKQIAAETDSKESKRVAEELATQLEQKYVDHALDVRARSAAAQLNSKRDTDIMRMLADMPEEQRANAAARIGPRAVELLGSMQKTDKGQAEVDETRAKADKARSEAAGAGDVRVRDQLGVTGLQPLPGATPQDKAKAQEIAKAHNDLDTNLAAMQKLQGEGGYQTKAEYDTAYGLAVGALNSLANAGVLNPGEVAEWKKRLPQHRVDNITTINPLQKVRAAFTDEEDLIGSIRGTFRTQSDQNLRTYNYERAPTAAEQVPTQAGFDSSSPLRDQARSAVSAIGRVKMVNMQTGATREVRPDLVQAYEQQGFVRNEVPAEAPQPETLPQSAAPSQRWPGAVGG